MSDDIERIRDALRFIPVGGHDERVRVAFMLKSEFGDAGRALWDEWRGDRGDDEADPVWRSAKESGDLTIASLIHEAKARGWINGNGHRMSHPTPKPKPTEQPAPKPNPAVRNLWDKCVPVGKHTYIDSKRGTSDGLRMIPAGDPMRVAGQSVSRWLVVPVRSLDGELRTLQLIPPIGFGKKLNMPDASLDDGLFVVGDIATSARCDIVEGIGQAWAVHRATGCAAIVTFGAGRTAKVAQIIRDRYPAMQLVIVPDRGKEPQAAEVARLVDGAWVELPDDLPKNYDVNDYAAEFGDAALSGLLHDALKRVLAGSASQDDERHQPDAGNPPSGVVGDQAWEYPAAIGLDEWESASASPRCIVRDLLFADVALMIGEGGTGKTTLLLHESINIALGLPVWDCEVSHVGEVLFLTAEDTREMLIARLRSLCAAMGLTPQQVAVVRERVRIFDSSGKPNRLTAVMDDVVQPNFWVEEIIADCAGRNIAMVVIDPAVSFGVGESRVNDAEQGLVMAGRRIRNALNCCVRYIHHTGKANGREKTTDQYAGRGGSSFADGSRMVHVLSGYSPSKQGEAKAWLDLTGVELDSDEQGIVYSRPKMTFTPPQSPIYIVRRGYQFRQVRPTTFSADDRRKSLADQLMRFIESELGDGKRYSGKDLENLRTTLQMTRDEVRAAITTLEVEERIKHEGKNGQKVFLIPSTLAEGNQE